MHVWEGIYLATKLNNHNRCSLFIHACGLRGACQAAAQVPAPGHQRPSRPTAGLTLGQFELFIHLQSSTSSSWWLCVGHSEKRCCCTDEARDLLEWMPFVPVLKLMEEKVLRWTRLHSSSKFDWRRVFKEIYPSSGRPHFNAF